MARKRKYTDDDFRVSVAESFSIAQVLSKLSLKPTGGNYTHFKTIAARLDVDYSHFTGQSHLKGKSHSWSPKRPLKEVLVKKSDYSRSHLKRRLLEEKLVTNECEVCGIRDWLDQPLVMHLDHINGDPIDHRLENLRMLCPNCHSQTSTYSNKKRK